MKKLFLFILMVSVCFMSSAAVAQQKAALGWGDVAVKVDYFRFTDDGIADDLSNGVYVGVEGYKSFFMPPLYFGLEVGWAGTSDDNGPTELSIDYVPIELNAKYVIDINPCWVFGVGGGISANYFNFEVDNRFVGAVDGDDWLFGGQVFADVNYKRNNWFVGANIKYQMTDDISLRFNRVTVNTDVSADNFRAGLQAGLMF